MSKCQTQRNGASGRRRLRRLHSHRGTKTQGKYRDGRANEKSEQKHKPARKIRRRNNMKRGAEQREGRVNVEKDSARSRIGELKVATYSVHALSLTGKERS